MGTFVPQQPQTQRLAVQVPPGMSAGQTIQFPGPGGGAFTATIPPGVPVGGTFMVEVAAPPVALPQATGVPMGSVPMGSVPMGLPMQQSGPPNAMPYRGPPPRDKGLLPGPGGKREIVTTVERSDPSNVFYLLQIDADAESRAFTSLLAST